MFLVDHHKLTISIILPNSAQQGVDHADEIYSGIALGRVITKDLYVLRNHELIFLYFCTDLFRKDISSLIRIRAQLIFCIYLQVCFVRIFPHSSE